MARSTTADARVSLRLPQYMKSRLERAAALAGHSSLSDFILTAAHTKAAEIVEREVKIELSAEDYDILVDHLNSKPEPAEAIKQFFYESKHNFVPKDRPDRDYDPF